MQSDAVHHRPSKQTPSSRIAGVTFGPHPGTATRISCSCSMCVASMTQRDAQRTGRCEERWLPGPTVAPYSRRRRGPGAEQSETRLVPFTTNMSLLARSIRGVSCLPGARPRGCATLTCEASCNCRDQAREPLWRRSSASAPAAVLQRRS
jgi:hypothetical protein